MLNFLMWLDQGANVIFGGNVDTSISARCYANRGSKYWKKLQRAIDWAFSPVEPAGHCKRSYLKDPEEYFDIYGVRRMFFPPCVYVVVVVIWVVNKIRSVL